MKSTINSYNNIKMSYSFIYLIKFMVYINTYYSSLIICYEIFEMIFKV